MHPPRSRHRRFWGDYMLDVKEASTKYLRNSRQGDFAVGGNTLGVILETASGKKVGLRHTYEIWVQPYELAFSAGSGLIGEKIFKGDLYYIRTVPMYMSSETKLLL